MNEKEQLVKKSLDLTDQEWEDLGEKTRNLILGLAEPIKTENVSDKDSRSKLAQGIREVLSLHPDQYNALPSFQREILLKKINDL